MIEERDRLKGQQQKNPYRTPPPKMSGLHDLSK
jgi:hypothetical protein